MVMTHPRAGEGGGEREEDLDAALIRTGGCVFLSTQIPTTPMAAHTDLGQFVE